MFSVMYYPNDSLPSEAELTNWHAQVPTYAIYIIEGTFLSFSNFLIFITIALFQQLRSKKQYIIVASLALVDGLSGEFDYFLVINE